MGRRKQHCPKKANEDGCSDSDLAAMEQQYRLKSSELAKLMHLQAAAAHRIALQQQQMENGHFLPKPPFPKDSPLDLSGQMQKQQQQQQLISHPFFPLQLGAAADKKLLFPQSMDFMPFPAALSSNLFMRGPQQQHYALSTLHRMSELAQMHRDSQQQQQQQLPDLKSWPLPQWLQKPAPPPSTTTTTTPATTTATTDVFRCVWCQERYSNLTDLTLHLKEAKHTSVRPAESAAAAGTRVRGKSSSSSPKPFKEDNTSTTTSSPSMPRKLVRGQDVWLGKGQEQTRQILKCMWCGESFKSLAELTVHMQETQHYTKVISQEQISSWKSGGGNSNGGGGADLAAVTNGGKLGSSNSNVVTSVLSCQVCGQSFSSLKDLSEHMVKDNHFKDGGCGIDDEPTPASAVPTVTTGGASRRSVKQEFNPAREKRKKSLPVRKLLELERGSILDFGENCCKKPKEEEISEIDKKLKTEPISSSTTNTNSGGSILGSLEKMVETSFTSKFSKRHETGILQQLGIDESPDPNTQHEHVQAILKRKFHTLAAASFFQQQQHHLGLQDMRLLRLLDKSPSPKSSSSPDDTARIVADSSSSSHNPLEALKELCNNNNNSKRRMVDSDMDENEVSSNEESFTPPPPKRALRNCSLSPSTSPPPTFRGGDDGDEEDEEDKAKNRLQESGNGQVVVVSPPPPVANDLFREKRRQRQQRRIEKPMRQGSQSAEEEEEEEEEEPLRQQQQRRQGRQQPQQLDFVQISKESLVVDAKMDSATSAAATAAAAATTVAAGQQQSAESKFFKYSELARQLSSR